MAKKEIHKRPRAMRATEAQAIEAEIPMQIEARTDGPISGARMREMAMIDFVTDPEQRGATYHYSRVDRPWRKHVSPTAFNDWVSHGNWIARRAQWWSQIEARILAKRAEQIAIQRVSEIEAMESARENMSRYLFPLTSRGGAIKLHPEFLENGDANPLAGLPMYGLRMPSLDRFVAAFIALDKHIMLKRGEAIERSAGVSDRLPDVNAHESGGVGSMSPEDLRAMARVLVRRRQPELNDQPEIIVSTLRTYEGEE